MLTPRLQQDIVRLGSWLPFGYATGELKHFTGTDVSRASAERLTEEAGAAYVEIQDEVVQQLEYEAPKPLAKPDRLFMSVDGAMVPVVGGQWVEVKTLVVGEVQPPRWHKGEYSVQTRNLSYFSRLTDSATFERLALVETHRRGVENAQAVGFVTDGSDWCQGFADHHRPDAVRILDFPHAGEHLGQVGQAVFGEGKPEAQAWLTDRLHQLKHTGPATTLDNVRQLAAARPELTDVPRHLAYLEKREAHLQYPTFQAAGWPIGDGSVESGNKLVVERRLKGSGMHWTPPHINPMLALRNIACSDRWAEAWPQIAQRLQQQVAQRRVQAHRGRTTRRASMSLPTTPSPNSEVVAAPPLPVHTPIEPPIPAPLVAEGPVPVKTPHRPAANHPWRRTEVRRSRPQPNPAHANAKS